MDFVKTMNPWNLIFSMDLPCESIFSITTKIILSSFFRAIFTILALLLASSTTYEIYMKKRNRKNIKYPIISPKIFFINNKEHQANFSSLILSTPTEPSFLT